MIEVGLLPKNGFNEEEKNVVLSCLFLDKQTVFIQNPIEINLNGDNADIDQFLNIIFH